MKSGRKSTLLLSYYPIEILIFYKYFVIVDTNILATFDNVISYMANCINDKFLKMQKQCEHLKEKEVGCVITALSNNKYIAREWVNKVEGEDLIFTFKYEDSCLSTEIPNINPEDCIEGMDTEEIRKFFCIDEIRVEVYEDNNFNTLIEVIYIPLTKEEIK